MVLHHHHAQMICVDTEVCQLDGQTNDSHTEHHEDGDDLCTIKQMHQFVVKSIGDFHLSDLYPAPLLPGHQIVLPILYSSTHTQHVIISSIGIPDALYCHAISRRGPPVVA